VERIGFNGLTFSHAEWPYPEGPHSLPANGLGGAATNLEVGGFSQAAVGVPGSIVGEGVRECVFENCTFSHVGGYGL
jgi:hypothetical protein